MPAPQHSLAAVAVVLASLVVPVRGVDALVTDGPARVDRAMAGRWVTVRPPYGRAPRAVREFLTGAEVTATSRIQKMIDGMRPSGTAPFSGGSVRWHIEPSVAGSALLRTQRRLVDVLDSALGPAAEETRAWPLDIIVARSSRYLGSTLAQVGCSPDLSRTGGTVLMGAAMCGRRVVASNITGFLFIRRADQRIDEAMERRREPPVRTLPYRIVGRSDGALAHEYAHIWRAAAAGGDVKADEPAWFAEGFAEFWSGVSGTLAYGNRLPYRTQHILRYRDFTDWSPACRGSLSEYRSKTSMTQGCEYHVGALAVEYLYAHHADVASTMRAFRGAPDHATFADSFEDAFGLSLEAFEHEADRYIDAVRKAEARG